MNDHNLDDLIIDSIEPNQSTTKNLLTIIALAIVFLIVGIFLAKFYTKEFTSTPLIQEEDTTEIIAPELKLQTPQKRTEPKEERSLSNIIEQEVNAPEVKAPEFTPKTTKMPEVEKPEIKSEAPIKVQEPIRATAKENAVQAIEVEPIKETVQITEEYTQKPEAIEIPKPEPKPKPIAKQETPKPSKPVAPPKKTVKSTTVGTYFIQVGYFKKYPSSRFLSVIKKSGFHYSITKPSSKGTKKLLIGPYPSRSAANTALIRVKDRINKQAFVVKR